MVQVEIRKVSFRYGANHILRNVSLNVRPGEFLTLVGPSGCGKSSLLRIIAGLAAQDDGEVWIDGRRVDALAGSKRDVAMVFQNYALYPHLTVEANLAVPLRMRELSVLERFPLVGRLLAGARSKRLNIDRRVRTTADALSIAHLLERKPSQLSGGQRQRVALGRAIVRNPRLFLMDEPLSNLDAQLRTQARAEIAQLHRRLGTTFIYVTHDQAEAMTMSDRIAVMMDKEIIQVGTPNVIYNDPNDLRVAEFVGSPKINVVPEALRAEGVDAAASQSGPRAVGKRRRLAFRPEAAKLVAAGTPASIGGRVVHSENMGSDYFVHVSRPDLTGNMVVRLDPSQAALARIGSDVGVLVDRARMLVFDEAGRRVRSASAPGRRVKT